jgi:hypothetical protein
VRVCVSVQVRVCVCMSLCVRVCVTSDVDPFTVRNDQL